eukprot:m.185150 g.185150  ORF g.185150 m.185150 type:complete len:169 (+) comp32222_c0_seq4:69-575(+)
MASFDGYKVGLIITSTPLKDKLHVLQVDVGQEANLTIVTNAPNAQEGKRVVVATIGSVVGEITVDKRSVGGTMSEGMLCDNPMLNWTGGGSGVAATLPDTFELGSTPPESRPIGGKQPPPSATPVPELMVKKKLTATEKKAAKEAQKAAIKAKKAARLAAEAENVEAE